MNTMTATRALTFLDETGDTTIVWDEDTDAAMTAIIERKMKEGFVFYIVKETPIVRINRLAKAKNIAEIRKAGSVVIKDEALEQLFLGGQIGTTRAPADDKIETVRKATNADEVATSQSVAVRPARGG